MLDGTKTYTVEGILTRKASAIPWVVGSSDLPGEGTVEGKGALGLN